MVEALKISRAACALSSVGSESARPTLLGLRAHSRRLQLLSQPPLLETSGTSARQGLAECEADRLTTMMLDAAELLPSLAPAIYNCLQSRQNMH